MITTTDTITIAINSISIITIAIITNSPGPNANTYAHNPWEASSRFCLKISVADLLSPRSNCLPFLQNLRPQLSTPWSWGILRFCRGVRAEDKIQTIVYTDIMRSAAGHLLPTTCHMPHATCLMPPGAWDLQLKKSLDRACRSIFGRSRVFDGNLLSDGTLWVCGSFG